MTQMMIEQLNEHEYSHLLAFGEPMTNEATSCLFDVYRTEPLLNLDGDESAWISTLESTTYPGMTYGYIDAL